MIAPADLIAGMAKGMAVLESFDTERQRLNATLAAERAGLTRAAARRHLLTLAHLGYLETDGSYFWLAPKVLRLSGSYLASSRLPRLTARTVTEAGTQRKRITQARLDDWAWSLEEHELGIQALAVPVRDMQGRTVAALNVVAAADRMDEQGMRQAYLGVLQEGARGLRSLV